MSWHRVDLGTQSFVSATSKLQLKIEASANLTDPELNLARKKLSLRLPLSFWSIFVVKSHDFHLSFSFLFDPSLQTSQEQQAALLQYILQTLESAQLWQQLSFIASIESPNSRNTSIITHSESVILYLRDSLHKDEDQVDLETFPREDQELTNLRPPDSIPHLLLSSVNVRFVVSPDSSCNPATSSPTKAISSDLKSPVRSPKSTPVVSAEALLSLVDAAFRSLLCPRPIRTFPKVKALPEVVHEHLADLAPVIFVPGYARSVADRARYIPMVAKFLVSFLVRADSLAIRSRLQDLLQENNHIETDFTETRVSNEGNGKLKSAVSGYLWMTVANSLRTMEPTRRLKPLQAPEDNGFGSWQSKFEDTKAVLGELGFAGYSNIYHSLSSRVNQMLFETEDEDSFENDETFLFDLYDASLTANTVPGSYGSVGTRNDDGFIELLDLIHSPHEQLFGYDCDGSSNTESMLGFTQSSTDACYQWIHPDIVVEPIYPHMMDPEAANIRAYSVDSRCLAEHSVVAGAAVMSGVISEPNALTEPTVRQHPAVALYNNDDQRDRRDSLFEELDYQENEERQLDGISIVLQKYRESGHILSDWTSTPDMTSETRNNRSSLSGILGGDHLLWHMWKNRASVTPRDEDILEMHATYSGYPDMRLLNRTKTNEEIRDDEEMLDGSLWTASSNSSVKSPANEYVASTLSRRQSTDRLPASRPTSSSSTDRTRPDSRSKSGQKFMKHLSVLRTFSKRASVDKQIQDYTASQPREMEIKRRKTLEDYELSPGGDDMLLG